MNLKEIKNTENPEADLAELLDIIHREGPKNSQLLESLSYFKVFHPIIFQSLHNAFYQASLFLESLM